MNRHTAPTPAQRGLGAMHRLNEHSRTPRRVTWIRVIAVAAVIAALAGFTQLLDSALRAGLSLFALVALVAFGSAALRTLPALGHWCETKLLAARLKAVRAEPIELLLEELVSRKTQLERFRSSLARIAVTIAGLQEMLEERREKMPPRDIAKQEAVIKKMEAWHAMHITRLHAAEQALADYKMHVESKRAEWRFVIATQEVLTGLRVVDREGIVRELMRDEASLAVEEKFRAVFHELDLDMRRIEQLEARNDAAPGGDPTGRLP